MARRATGWTCPRQSGGVKCGHRNRPRTRVCGACGKPRPAKRSPAHMAALELDYAGYVRINGGDHCGVCGRKRSASRRLDRDHDHHTKLPRGLACPRCNRALPAWITVEWLQAAIRYLETADERRKNADTMAGG